MPGAPSSDTPRESQAKLQSRDRVGIVERSCGYQARGVSFRGKFVLSRHVANKTKWGRHANKTKWGRHVAKRSSDARQAYPEVVGGRYRGKFRFIEPHRRTGPRRHVPGLPSNDTLP